MSDAITCPKCGSESNYGYTANIVVCKDCDHAWNQPERLLRDRIAALEAENAELRDAKAALDGMERLGGLWTLRRIVRLREWRVYGGPGRGGEEFIRATALKAVTAALAAKEKGNG